jgi:hypothetical protein
MDPEGLHALAARYGCEVDFERTMQIVQNHELSTVSGVRQTHRSAGSHSGGAPRLSLA